MMIPPDRRGLFGFVCSSSNPPWGDL